VAAVAALRGARRFPPERHGGSQVGRPAQVVGAGAN
jgi:hypothetical protein